MLFYLMVCGYVVWVCTLFLGTFVVTRVRLGMGFLRCA